MATKLFKIGESSYHGKWRLTIKGNKVITEGIDWMTGEVMEKKEFTVEPGLYRNLKLYLAEQSTFYWAEHMTAWVEKRVKG